MKTKHLLLLAAALLLLYFWNRKRTAQAVAANDQSLIPVNDNSHVILNGVDPLHLTYVPGVGNVYPNAPLLPGIGGMQGLPGTAANGVAH